MRTTIDRLMGRHSDERAWRIGAKGERLVGEELRRLSGRDPRWTALHAIPVGRRGADIDHLLMGPGGVFALNTKHHPDARIRVNGSTFTVNGHRVPYVHRSEREAERATRLLSAAVGRPVPVTGVIVPVGCRAPITVAVQPRWVHVVTRRDLVGWMSALGPVWSVPDLHQIWEKARRSTTWARD
ncbi:nuclease-related domain-containing protein [uncultured Nocardioides sp.]|uniref:nuclease-related domain-containing protein n=1 Tax=uncultured Nocardioides sp. TaxID=198441 RepID=UPI002607CFF1|nr:nuclease-related domain-containing protein [uncultured Nocardioides sp.]